MALFKLGSFVRDRGTNLFTRPLGIMELLSWTGEIVTVTKLNPLEYRLGFRVDGARHGHAVSDQNKSRFFVRDKDITQQVRLVVSDIHNLTQEERMIIKLRWGIDCITKKTTL